MEFRRRRIEAKCPRQRLERRLRLALPQGAGADQVSAEGIAGCPLVNSFTLSQGMAIRVDVQICLSKIDPDRHVVRLQLEGALKLSDRIAVPRLRLVRPPQKMPRSRELRVDLKRILQRDDRLIVFAGAVVPDALLQVAVLPAVWILDATGRRHGEEKRDAGQTCQHRVVA